MSTFWAIVARDVRLAVRGGTESVMVLVFFVLAAILFPFGVGPEAEVLRRIGPGVIWVVALLAAMMSLERLFSADHEDGTLDLLATSPAPLEIVFLAKAIAHWLTTGLPLLVAAPVLGVFYQLPGPAFGVLLLSMLLGTPSLSLIGGVGAALIVGARRGGVLLALLVLPLYVPVLIFAVAGVDAVIFDAPVRPSMMILAALLLAAIPLCPWAGGAALRQALQ